MDKHQQPHFAGMAQIETGRPHTSPILILAGAPLAPPIRPLPAAQGNNGLILDPDRYDRLSPETVALAALEAEQNERLGPFAPILDELDRWVAEHDDCPGLATVLDWIDAAGVGRSFSLHFWLERWRRA